MSRSQTWTGKETSFHLRTHFLKVRACVYKHSKFLLDTEMLGFSGSKRKLLSLERRLGANSLHLSEHGSSLAFSSKSLGPLCYSVLRAFDIKWQILAVSALLLDTKAETGRLSKNRGVFMLMVLQARKPHHMAPASDWFLVGTSYCCKSRHQKDN